MDKIFSLVKKAIDKFKLFTKDEKILVAISGGKDSLVTAFLLKQLGYNVEGLFIDLGYENYSLKSLQAAKQLENFDIKLNILNLKEEFGFTMPQLFKVNRTKKFCSICGVVKRYAMNYYAVKENFDCLATGHTLTDEITITLFNMLSIQFDLLARVSPKLEAWHKNFVRKVKPICLITDFESSVIAEKLNLIPVKEECPYSKKAATFTKKKVTHVLEENYLQMIRSFYINFFKKKQLLLNEKLINQVQELKECEICGQPTTTSKCYFCRLREKVLNGTK